MSIKDQIRATTDPQKFVPLALQALKAKQDANLIPPDHFEYVTGRVFDDIGPDAHQALKGLHTIAHHATQGARLADQFYRAVTNGLGRIEILRDRHLQEWPEFFKGLTSLLQSDARLRKIVAAQVVVNGLPNMVWSIDAKRPAALNAQIIHTSTGIIQALEGVPGVLKDLDPAPVETLVREYVAALGGPLTAAPVLMELRKSETFRATIMRQENAAGEHVVAYKTSFRKPGHQHDSPLHLGLVFSREAGTIAAYALTRTREGITSTPVQFGNGLDATIANVLFDHSSADLTGQEWVKPLAEEKAFALI